MKILLTICYDGTDFLGWQRQKDESIRTVQSSLEKSCSKLFKETVECTGASRTDRGVHALGQRVTIDVNTTIPVNKIPLALNSFLPPDIVVVDAEVKNDDFHVRYDVINKTYEYKILNQKYRNPIFRNYTEFVREELDIIKMNQGAKFFLGTHDFKGFCASGSSVRSTVRTIYKISVIKNENIVKISVTGNGFLYNMVRIIAGTLIYVGYGKINPEDIPQIIESGDRGKAGKTAGPSGLTLKCINYM